MDCGLREPPRVSSPLKVVPTARSSDASHTTAVTVSPSAARMSVTTDSLSSVSEEKTPQHAGLFKLPSLSADVSPLPLDEYVTSLMMCVCDCMELSSCFSSMRLRLFVITSGSDCVLAFTACV